MMNGTFKYSILYFVKIQNVLKIVTKGDYLKINNMS